MLKLKGTLTFPNGATTVWAAPASWAAYAVAFSCRSERSSAAAIRPSSSAQALNAHDACNGNRKCC